MLVSKCRHTWG